MSQYIPGAPPYGADLEALQQWMVSELGRIAFATTNGDDRVRFVVQYAAPTKYAAGDTFHADGVKWNPGTGEGKYRRNAANTLWVKES